MIEKLEELQQKKKRQNYFSEIDFYDGKNVIQTISRTGTHFRK